jgi:hypothetical protein
MKFLIRSREQKNATNKAINILLKKLFIILLIFIDGSIPHSYCK